MFIFWTTDIYGCNIGSLSTCIDGKRQWYFYFGGFFYSNPYLYETIVWCILNLLIITQSL